jgi:hypothetical protein
VPRSLRTAARGIPRDYLGSVNSRNVTRNRRGEPDNATLEYRKVSLGEDARRGKRKHRFRDLRPEQFEHIIGQGQPPRLVRMKKPKAWVQAPRDYDPARSVIDATPAASARPVCA